MWGRFRVVSGFTGLAGLGFGVEGRFRLDSSQSRVGLAVCSLLWVGQGFVEAQLRAGLK